MIDGVGGVVEAELANSLHVLLGHHTDLGAILVSGTRSWPIDRITANHSSATAVEKARIRTQGRAGSFLFSHSTSSMLLTRWVSTMGDRNALTGPWPANPRQTGNRKPRQRHSLASLLNHAFNCWVHRYRAITASGRRKRGKSIWNWFPSSDCTVRATRRLARTTMRGLDASHKECFEGSDFLDLAISNPLKIGFGALGHIQGRALH